MYVGTKMTLAAAQRLKFEGVPQERAVCVTADLWDDYVLGETPIERTCYVMQVLHDLNEYLSNGRGDTRLVEVSAVTMKWGLVVDFRDSGSRKVPGVEPLVKWVNKTLVAQTAPQVAVRDDGRLVRVLIGELGDLTSVRFQHFKTTGHALLDRYQSEANYARNNNIHNPIPYGSTEWFTHMWEFENGREMSWDQ